MHDQPHPLAGQIVSSPIGDYQVEDWWDRLTGGSWMDANGNPAALKYAVRAGAVGLPIDDEVVYGSNGLGNLVHDTELTPLGSTETDQQPVVGTMGLDDVYTGQLDDVTFRRPS